MREFNVHFSFYSEERGNFDVISYPIMAETSFEAREKAWSICDQDADTPLRSNIKQFAVTWSPNQLDAGDYFYSHAADIKHDMGRLLNVDIPNDQITGSDRQHQLEGERRSNLGALWTLDTIAKDLYAGRGMIPPSIYEELYYAEKLCEHLGWGEKTDALWERIENAKKWDNGAIYNIRDMLKNGYTTLCGETVLFREHFGRDGIYPVHNKLDELDYTYISRWKNRCKVETLKRLPNYSKADTIQNGFTNFDITWHTLLLDSKMLVGGIQTAENQLWKVLSPLDYIEDVEIVEKIGNNMLLVENPITEQRTLCSQDSFLGVMRPDIIEHLDFNALKKEYMSNNFENIYSIGADTDDNEFER